MTSKTKTKLLTALSIAGILTTTGIAIRSGDRLSDIYERYTAELNYNHEKTEEEIKLEYAKKAAKEVLPLAASLIFTISSVAFLAGRSIKREAALASALYLAQDRLQKLSKTDKDVDKYRLEDKTDIPNKPNRILLYEPYSDQVIVTTEAKIRKAEDKANARLQQYYLVRLSSIIRDLGGKPAPITDYIGWETANKMQMQQWNLANDIYIKLLMYPAHYSVHEKPLDCLDYDIPPAMLSS